MDFVRIRSILLLMSCLSVVVPASAQGLQDWTAHTSFGQANDLMVTGTHTWVATDGGIYSVEHANGAMTRMTVADGLSNVRASALAADATRGVIWVGYDDGLLDRIDASSGTVRTYRDIARADQYPSRGINRIRVLGDSVLVATQFGVVIFDPARNEVRDSFDRFDTLPVGMEVNDVLVESEVFGVATIWVATDAGIAHASLDGRNLKDPGSWMAESGSGLQIREALSLGALGGEMYVGTDNDLYRRTGPGLFSALFVTNRAVNRLAMAPDALVGSATFTVIVVRDDGSRGAYSIDGYGFPSAVDRGPAGELWVADGRSGVMRIPFPAVGESQVSPLEVFLPSGPADGTFSRLSVSDEGQVWLSGVNAAGTGFYRLDREGEWTTWSSGATTELAGKGAFVHIHASADESGWAGSEGGGVARVEPDGTVTLFGTGNSSLRPATGTSDFIIVGGLHEDNQGNMWVSTRGSSQPLHVRMADGDWTGFSPLVGQGLVSSSTAYGRLFVDSFDQKWIVIHREEDFRTRKGLMVLETGIPENPSDDVFRYFDTRGGSGQGLPSVSLNAVMEDRDGLVWLGTDSGPAFFINTGIVARDGSARPIWPQWANRELGTFMLFGLAIHDMAVDPAGRIWFATDNGAWLVESAEGGYALVEHFTTDNSPLFSDVVLAVAVNDATGEVFFSTDRGLVSYASDAIAPREEAGNLVVFPNPVRISDGQIPSVYVEGLMPAADIRIVTVAGHLVRRLESRGGRIRWDARDEEGRLVDSGVYLVIAVGRNDEGTSVGKLVVIR
ncbi:MAG: regulator [Bacteroidetes bacterium]|nr:regulator [Bacteroidota bacterium]